MLFVNFNGHLMSVVNFKLVQITINIGYLEKSCGSLEQYISKLTNRNDGSAASSGHLLTLKDQVFRLVSLLSSSGMVAYLETGDILYGSQSYQILMSRWLIDSNYEAHLGIVVEATAKKSLGWQFSKSAWQIWDKLKHIFCMKGGQALP